MEFAKVLGEVTRFLEERGYRYGLAGAFALHAYGLMRATADLDFVVEHRAKEDLLRFLDGLGYERLHLSQGYSNHVHPLASLGRLDFIYVDSQTAELMFGAARQVAFLSGKHVPVPKPEHLAAMKILAMKNDPTRALQEMADIQFLLGLPGVDEDEIRRYFERHGMQERFDEIKRNMPARS
ncbi:MAG: hypothetical protein ACYC8T_02895 [Myxococcaceae bacterium]